MASNKGDQVYFGVNTIWKNNFYEKSLNYFNKKYWFNQYNKKKELHW